MRQLRYLIGLAALLISGLAYGLDASISVATFYGPQQNYAEVCLFFSGRTLKFVANPDSSLQAAVEVVIVFKQQERIVQFDKYRLSSPTSGRPIDFVDLKRYALPNGVYDMEISVADLNRPEDKRDYKAPITINYAREGKLQQSDINLLASVAKSTEEGPFTKNGLTMEPLPYAFYGRNVNTLSFYSEVYHADQVLAEPFVLTYSIEKLNGAQTETIIISHKRQDPAPLIPVFQQIDISKLPSGNYRLAVEVRNRAKEVLDRRSIDFQRSNPIWDLEALSNAAATPGAINTGNLFTADMPGEELKYSLLAILPLMPQRDVEVVNLMLRYDSLRAQRLYLYSFWAKESPADPKAGYDKFMEVARAVDKMFNSGFRYGFETDRGYVYIKYGQPNDMVRQETEPSAPPYEIWSYNEVKRTNQNNVRFIFYNPSLASDDFVLLHSDVYGEINNPQWQMKLYQDAPGEFPDDYLQGTDVQDNIGRRIRQNMRDW
jgi:GWxTD domain-containing protein